MVIHCKKEVKTILKRECLNWCKTTEEVDDMYRLWIFLLFSTFLFATNKMAMRGELLHYLTNFDRINWEEHIHAQVIENIEKCRKMVMRREESSKLKCPYVFGYTLVLNESDINFTLFSSKKSYYTLVCFASCDSNVDMVVGAYITLGETEFYCTTCLTKVGWSLSLQKENYFIIKNQQVKHYFLLLLILNPTNVGLSHISSCLGGPISFYQGLVVK